MVFFTCLHCGESVKKPTVSKHYQTKCRKKEPLLTCIDCLKDFKGTEFESHTKCLTEDEKYSAKGNAPKPQNKGEKKQQAWQECIQIVLKKPTLKPDERDLIRAISKYENVPRKKAKFINFLSNAFKQYANKTDLIDRVWTEMESLFKEMTGNTNEEQNHQDEKGPQQEQQKVEKQDSKSASKKVAPKAEEKTQTREKKRKRQAEEEKSGEISESGKADEKLKKKKQKSNPENVVEGNTNTLINDETKNEQEKKNRKRKANDDGQTEQDDSVADEAEPGKKKKKNDKPPENQTKETPAQNPEVEGKSKKKNKKPKSENSKAKPEEGAPLTGGGDANPVKKEKKGKKSENKENRDEKPDAQNAKATTQGETEKQPPKKKKAPKAEAGGDSDKQEGSFAWKATILQVLNQEGKNSKIQLQKLQKKVLQLHCQILNCENSEKKEKKFMKKLKEMPEVEIDKDFVVLKS